PARCSPPSSGSAWYGTSSAAWRRTCCRCRGRRTPASASGTTRAPCSRGMARGHSSRPVPARHGYRSARMVTQMLVDIVAKNGNLMLNVPLPGSGEPDSAELSFIAYFTHWMKPNGTAIFASRPWSVYGEGPSTQAQPALREQGFNEGKNKPYTAEDIRFVHEGEKVYAFMLAWPENGKVTIKSLAVGSPHTPGRVERVELFTTAPWG